MGGTPLRLSDYATQEDSGERYFKNRMGGLGQYYVGSLAELGLCAKAFEPYGGPPTGVLLTNDPWPGQALFPKLPPIIRLRSGCVLQINMVAIRRNFEVPMRVFLEISGMDASGAFSSASLRSNA